MSLNLSASSIKDFLTCSQRYYYRINTDGIEIPSEAMLTGTIVHNTIEHCWNKELDTAMYYANSYMLENNIKIKNYTYIKKIETSLENFYSNYKSLLTKDDEIEKKFRIKYGDNIYFVGRIDRIVKQPNDNNLLIDWKTSSRNPLSIDTDEQFLFYKKAYEILYNRPPSRVLYINLFTNTILALNDNGDNYNTLFEETIPYIIKRIKANNFKKEGLKKKNVCKYCPFREHCLADGGKKKKL